MRARKMLGCLIALLVAAGPGALAAAAAGDLDGDGAVSRFRLIGQVVGARVIVAPQPPVDSAQV